MHGSPTLHLGLLLPREEARGLGLPLPASKGSCPVQGPQRAGAQCRKTLPPRVKNESQPLRRRHAKYTQGACSPRGMRKGQRGTPGTASASANISKKLERR